MKRLYYYLARIVTPWHRLFEAHYALESLRSVNGILWAKVRTLEHELCETNAQLDSFRRDAGHWSNLVDTWRSVALKNGTRLDECLETTNQLHAAILEKQLLIEKYELIMRTNSIQL